MDKGTYDVGYKKPPGDSRWKPGESGNPRGRANGRRSTFLDDVAEVSSEPLRAMVAGQEIEVDLSTAVFRKLIGKAINGNMTAMIQVVGLIQELEALLATKDVETTQNLESVRKFCRLCTNTPEEAEAAFQKYVASRSKRRRRQAAT